MLVVVFLFLWTTLQLFDITLALPASPSIGQLESRGIPIPDCANSCLKGFIAQAFPISTCPNQQDLNCLCTNQGLQGYTLGEGALQCVISSCSNPGDDLLQGAYTLCKGISGAVSATHATITITLPQSTATFASGTTTIPIITLPTLASSAATSSLLSTTSGLSFGTPSSTISSTSSGSPSSSTSALSLPTAATSSSTSPTQTGTASAATTSSPTLTQSQVIGISVGVPIFAIILMALLTYFCCFGRRQNRESVQSWGTNQPLMSRVENPDGFMTSPRMPHVNPYVPSKAQSILGQKYPIWSPVTSPQRDYPVHFGQDKSTSMLLPDRPAMPAPPRPPRDGTEGVILTRGTIGGSRPNLKSSPDSFTSPVVRTQPADPFTRPAESSYARSDYQRLSKPKLPKLDTNSSTAPVHPPLPTYNPTAYARFAESQIYDQGSTVKNATRDTILPGTAVTTNRSASTAQTPRTRSARETQVFDKYKPIPPPKRLPAASTVTSFESDHGVETATMTSQLPPLPFTSNWNRQNSKRVVRKPSPDIKSTTPVSLSTTPISQIRYPVVPSSTVTPISPPTNQPEAFLNRPLHQLKRQDSIPLDVSPITPQLRRKDSFVLAQEERQPAPRSQPRASSLPLAELSAQATTPRNQNFSKRVIGAGIDSPLDVSRLLNSGYAELPERGSSKRWSASDTIIPVHLGQDVVPPLPGAASAATPPKTHGPPQIPLPMPPPPPPAAMMLSELPSPDAERVNEPQINPLDIAGQAMRSASKKQSRGARLGAAMASKTAKAKPASPTMELLEQTLARATPSPSQQPQSPLRQQQRQYPSIRYSEQDLEAEEELHPALRSRPDLAVDDEAELYSRAQPQGQNLHPTLSLIGSPSSRPTMSREHTGGSVSANENIRGTAKWTVLCKPGEML